MSQLPSQPISNLAKRHRDMLMIALVVIACSFSLKVVNGQQVAFRWWPAWVAPETCGSRRWFGVDCPGCGLTRSFVYLSQGEIRNSVAVNRVGWVLALSVLAQIPYRIASLRSKGPVLPPLLCKWFGNALIAMLILNWLWNQFQRYLG